MSNIFYFGGMKPLLPDETILHYIPRVGYITAKALPTYRIAFPIPLLLRMSLYITDRRILFIARMFPFIVQENSTWFPGCEPDDDPELVESSSVGNNPTIGPYLEFIYYNEHRPWYYRYLCAARVRIRIYMKNPQPVCDIITAQLMSSFAR